MAANNPGSDLPKNVLKGTIEDVNNNAFFLSQIQHSLYGGTGPPPPLLPLTGVIQIKIDLPIPNTSYFWVAPYTDPSGGTGTGNLSALPFLTFFLQNVVLQTYPLLGSSTGIYGDPDRVQFLNWQIGTYFNSTPALAEFQPTNAETPPVVFSLRSDWAGAANPPQRAYVWPFKCRLPCDSVQLTFPWNQTGTTGLGFMRAGLACFSI